MNVLPDDGVSLFVFAHQDDELCAAPIIASRKTSGRPVRIVFMTDGAAGRASSDQRDAESRSALRNLGIREDEIVFLGSRKRFPDGALYQVLPEAAGALRSAVEAIEAVGEIFTLAYEGGHQDHDATHATTVSLARDLGLLHETRQIPFYRAASGAVLPVAVWAPLPENGPVTWSPTTRAMRLRTAALTRKYPSQWRVIVGLGPLLAAASAVRPGVPLQPVSLDRLKERPTTEPLFYERRGEVEFADVARAISQLA
jgi:LmbE family N-acetylglucosaminyl deacetylase